MDGTVAVGREMKGNRHRENDKEQDNKRCLIWVGHMGHMGDNNLMERVIF